MYDTTKAYETLVREVLLPRAGVGLIMDRDNGSPFPVAVTVGNQVHVFPRDPPCLITDGDLVLEEVRFRFDFEGTKVIVS